MCAYNSGFPIGDSISDWLRSSEVWFAISILGSNFNKECSPRQIPLMARLSAANNLEFHCHPKVTYLRVTPYRKVTYQLRLIHAKIAEYTANRWLQSAGDYRALWLVKKLEIEYQCYCLNGFHGRFCETENDSSGQKWPHMVLLIFMTVQSI